MGIAQIKDPGVEAMLERFTNLAIELLMRAKFEAGKQQKTAGTDVVLLTMLGQTKELPYKCLDAAGLTLQQAQEIATKNELPVEEDVQITGFSSLVKNLIELSINQADELEHKYVASEHILMALLKMKESRGYRLIEQAGISPDSVLADLIKAIKEKDSTDFSPEPVTHADSVSMQVFSQDAEFLNSFSQASVKIITLGQSEARNLNCRFAGTECLLLALLKEESCLPSKVLRSLSVQLDTARAEVKSLLQKSDSQEFLLNIPLTTRAKNILRLSKKEAAQLGNRSIEPEHILLAIEREGRKHGTKLFPGKAYTVLKRLGVEKEIRTVILQELDKL